MRIAMGIDVGSNTGIACVGYFDTSKKTMVLGSETIPDRKIGPFASIMHKWVTRHHPDNILVELPIISKQITHDPAHLEAVVTRLKAVLANYDNVTYVLPTQWKQTPSATFSNFVGNALGSQHERDAARMCHWFFTYSALHR